jgi:hypothetical protein
LEWKSSLPGLVAIAVELPDIFGPGFTNDASVASPFGMRWKPIYLPSCLAFATPTFASQVDSSNEIERYEKHVNHPVWELIKKLVVREMKLILVEERRTNMATDVA